MRTSQFDKPLIVQWLSKVICSISHCISNDLATVQRSKSIQRGSKIAFILNFNKLAEHERVAVAAAARTPILATDLF